MEPFMELQVQNGPDVVVLMAPQAGAPQALNQAAHAVVFVGSADVFRIATCTAADAPAVRARTDPVRALIPKLPTAR
jgi:hypothetical protein